MILGSRAETASEAGARALFEQARRRRRRRRLAWTAGTVALVMIAASLALALRPGPAAVSGRPGHGAASIPLGGGMPAQIVAWTADSRIEVLSARNGRVLRTLASNVGIYEGTPSLAVSPAGTVYFYEGMYINGVPGDVILRVPVSGGPLIRVARGRSPAISPDGHFLAYVTGGDTLSPFGASRPFAITIMDLAAGTRRSWPGTSADAWPDALSWSPDSRYLSFTSTSPAGAEKTPAGPIARYLTTYLILDRASDGGPLAAARRIPIPRGIAWAGFLAEDGHRLVGVGVRTGRHSAELVALDASSGRILRRLMAIPTGLFTGNCCDGAEGTVQVDPSGRFILVEAIGTGDGRLYLWRAGTDHIRSLGSGIDHAVLVPAPVIKRS